MHFAAVGDDALPLGRVRRLLVSAHRDELQLRLVYNPVQHRSRVADVRANELFLVRHYHHSSRPAQLRVDVDVLLQHIVERVAQFDEHSLVI